ncbi:sensor histidine kinase [Undibacterium sp.]|uniref:sensor histidine kinase n=1 Tax=Undibacterium sp. TaxID=1914977 RepID=UPI0025D47C5E|nr:histidine kinase [Undibacterium sp.]
MTEQALPSEVTLQSETWLTRYRNFAVFSRAWYRHRSYAWSGMAWIAFFLMLAIFYLARWDMRAFLAFSLPILFGIQVLALLGSGMATWLRQKNYPEQKEALLLSLAVLLGAVFSYMIFEGSRYTASYLAYGDGSLEIKLSDLKHPSAQFSPQLKAAESVIENSKDAVDTKSLATFKRAVDAVATLVVLLHLGSGFDLWIFFRQRKKLMLSLQKEELKRAQDARREAELRLSVLAAQVEPHFLFNTLAGVRSAILTEPLRATMMVDHLVDFLRASIPQMRGDGTASQGRLAQQLDAARAYLGLMQARIPRLTFSISSEIEDAALPPLLLISLVENAVKHGVEPKIGPVHIQISARRLLQNEETFLQLQVSDNGTGFSGSVSGSGIGLVNIRERLASTYGASANLSLKSLAQGGVAAIIVLPFTSE